MEYLNIIRNLRRLSLMAFLTTIFFVIVFWAFTITNSMQYFMWAMPGFDLETTNTYIMWLTGALEIAGILLFLIPTIVLSIEIMFEKRRLIREEEEFLAFKDEIFGTLMEPAPAKAKPKAKAKAKPKKKK